jgi:hypothetical protein
MEHLAWPGAVVIITLGVFAMLLFRVQLKGFFSRLHEIGWMKLLAHPPAVPQETKDIIPKQSKVDALLKGFDNKMLLDFEGVVLQILRDNEVIEPADRERVLLRYLANAWVSQFLESTYNSIFGSQIQALHMLNQNPNGLQLELIKVWYEVGKAGYPAAYENWPVEKWIGWLQTSMLVTVNGDVITITAFGNEFLRYLVQGQKSMNKLG